MQLTICFCLWWMLRLHRAETDHRIYYPAKVEVLMLKIIIKRNNRNTLNVRWMVELIFRCSFTDYYHYYGSAKESSAISFAWVSLVPLSPHNFFFCCPIQTYHPHYWTMSWWCDDLDGMRCLACPYHRYVFSVCVFVCVSVSRVVFMKRLWAFWTSLLSECLHTNWYAADECRLQDQKKQQKSYSIWRENK